MERSSATVSCACSHDAFCFGGKAFSEQAHRDWYFCILSHFSKLLAAGLTFNATFVASLATFPVFFIATWLPFEIAGPTRGRQSRGRNYHTG